MNWITNIAFPITERTDTIQTLQAYNKACYQRALLSVQSAPFFNYTYGQTQNNGWNFFQNNNWNTSLFSFDLTGNTSSYLNNFWNFGNILYGNNRTSNGVIKTTPTYTPPSPIKSPTKPSTTTPATTPTATQPKNPQGDKELASAIAQNAGRYIGYNESDGSFRRFSNDPEWCADFVTYVVKEAYRNRGLNPPSGFGSWRCENLMQWGIRNGKFLKTAKRSDTQELIKTRVKPGDIVVMREFLPLKPGQKQPEQASHTGIVVHVDKETGNYQTIEGNVTTSDGDKVVKMNHSFDDPAVSGFIQLA